MSVEMAMLLVLEGLKPGLRLHLDQPEVIIGRREDCSLVIPERQVSRQHARITLERDRYVLEDLGSKNGTFVNGERLTEPRPLQDGDEIQIALCCRLAFVGADATVPVVLDEQPHGLRIEPDKKRVWVAGRVLDPPLSLPQYRLLELLHQEPGRVYSRDEVVEAVWPEENRNGISEQAIDALARRLRERLADADPAGQYVVTVRGHGFKLQDAAR